MKPYVISDRFQLDAPKRRSRLAIILVLAAVLRVVWALVVEVHPISDCLVYDQTARMIADYGTFGFEPDKPTTFWPPGASALYAVLFKLFGHSFLPVVALNIALGVAVVYITYALAAHALGHRPGLIAGLFVALWPMHVQFTTVLASELPFTALLLAGMLVWLKNEKEPIVRIFLGGTLFALACYMRPTALLIPPIMAGLDLLFRPNKGRTFVHAAAMGALMALLIAPWTYRNYKAFDAFVPISANSGTNLWMGNNPDTTGYYQDYPKYPELNEAQADRERGKLAKAYIAKEPLAFVKRTLVKLVGLHKSQTIGVHWNAQGLQKHFSDATLRVLKIASSAYWWGMLALAVFGVVGLVVRDGVKRTLLSPLLYCWAYFALIYAVWVIQDRYTFPSTPMIAGLAAAGFFVVCELFFTPPRPAAA